LCAGPAAGGREKGGGPSSCFKFSRNLAKKKKGGSGAISKREHKKGEEGRRFVLYFQLILRNGKRGGSRHREPK